MKGVILGTINTKIAMLAAVMTIGALAFSASANAALFNLSFSGQVDVSGATVGGVAAPLGSPFTLDFVVDDVNAAIGSYGIQNISYTTMVGTYNTISTWGQMQATQVGPSIDLSSGGFIVNPTTEHFLLNLTNFGGGSSFNNILSWNGVAITGDIIVRGVGGFGSLDQLSGIQPFTGTLSVSPAAIPEPGTLALFGLGLAGAGAILRRKRKA
jgi:hypothetical protein